MGKINSFIKENILFLIKLMYMLTHKIQAGQKDLDKMTFFFKYMINNKVRS